MIHERYSEQGLHATVLTWFFGIGSFNETFDEFLERRSQVPAAARKPLVLLADDEVLIRDTMTEILRAEGYDAFAVPDGVEAIECAAKVAPDVFLADVSMPRMNGIEAAKQILQRAPDTHVICISGHAATSELLAQARKEGRNFDFLGKPIRPETLLQAIRTKVGRSIL
ncbi:MAG TPA: response regulator [Terracidiphilus sp.]|nr:response regulator [Terracidiphilus sp.]